MMKLSQMKGSRRFNLGFGILQQAAAAASTLQDQARRLQRSVSVFVLTPQA